MIPLKITEYNTTALTFPEFFKGATIKITQDYGYSKQK
jgi:hypothetical protein